MTMYTKCKKEKIIICTQATIILNWISITMCTKCHKKIGYLNGERHLLYVQNLRKKDR